MQIKNVFSFQNLDAPMAKINENSNHFEIRNAYLLLILICRGIRSLENIDLNTVKSRAVDRSTIQFLTNFGVLLTETCSCSRLYGIQSGNHKGFDPIETYQ